MAFVKLDVGILDSTLWVDKDARELFITALLMAVPREFPAPVPQYKVEDSAIVQTGFVAPPGWYGFVPAAGSGIVRRCGMPEDAGKLALERLGDPEEGSRSGAHSGRRMIRIDGGYLILNYVRYRDKDHTAALRQQRFRERKRHAVTVTGNAVTVTPVTQAEVEAYTEALKSKDKPRAATQLDTGEVLERIPLNTGEEFEVRQSYADELKRLYPLVDVPQTLREARGWCLAKPERRKTHRGVRAFLNGWMTREQNRG